MISQTPHSGSSPLIFSTACLEAGDNGQIFPDTLRVSTKIDNEKDLLLRWRFLKSSHEVFL